MTNHISFTETTKLSLRLRGLEKNRNVEARPDERITAAAASRDWRQYALTPTAFQKKLQQSADNRHITSHQPLDRNTAGGRMPCRCCVGRVSERSGRVKCCLNHTATRR